MADEKLTREDCLALLRGTRERLLREGIDRYPKRADYTDAEVVAIKAFLGPWPRALEAAGINGSLRAEALPPDRLLALWQEARKLR